MKDINFKNRKVLIRVDFNVPLDSKLKVSDDTRILASKPTIKKILDDGGSCILMSHLGRPKASEKEFSMLNILYKIEEIFERNVVFSNDCIGWQAKELSQGLKPGEILLLENLRYYQEETNGNYSFAKELASLGDFYINDAFGTAHRAHASTSVIAQFFPNSKCFGYLLSKEIKAIGKVMESGEKPIVAILGGAKVSSKIKVILNILDMVDHVIIGGGMAYTFIKALGGSIGDSIIEPDKVDTALSILDLAKEKKVKIHLPQDVIIADRLDNSANIKISDAFGIPKNWQGLDCGPKSSNVFNDIIQDCKTILWNGPLGVFELSKFSEGTKALGRSVVNATSNGAFSLVGGGDSVAAVKMFNFESGVSYVSTGGGAMLESLEGKSLPGIRAINMR